MRDDIFPMIETEHLVKFRISYLRRQTWNGNSLFEYYTIALKYQDDGRYELDVWRAGTGKQHVASTDSQLWNLGDYLSRLSSRTGPLHWTLAFHATDRPDDRPIGVWKFDRTDFDDANFGLQQQHGYAYARLTSLEVMPLPPADTEDVILETSPEPELQVGSLGRPKLAKAAFTERKRKRAINSNARNGKSPSPPPRRPRAAQLSPPLTLSSSRNASKDATTDKSRETEAGVNPNDGLFQGTEGTHIPRSRKGLVTKRKPKRPVQLFENAASSLPATQIISQSQSLSQRTLGARDNQVHMIEDKSADQGWLMEGELRSSSSDLFDSHKLLDGISLSSEPISVMQFPHAALTSLPAQLPDTQYDTRQGTPEGKLRGALRLGPASGDSGAYRGMTQWQTQASLPAPANILGITISDDEELVEAPLVGNPRNLAQSTNEQDDHAGISYSFSPNTVSRRKSLFDDLPGSSDGEI
ncbi:hypothetical protein F5144DRAFT_559806 [Chaetomium tenue]|uniref:Uncharacterized protein n=1 Tax=Chaetomium tenue TaxID=1854479 RepID=A0ACB7PEL3_9PEZI|nr:hypothetical protein F5144DRAFT_559806 [Chaetomium globosum]